MKLFNKKLAPSSYMLYAVAVYQRKNAFWSEFFADMYRFSTVSRMLVLRKTKKTNNIRKIINQLVYLGNIFPSESLARLLFFNSDESVHPEIKTILRYLYRLPDCIPECDLQKIGFSEDIIDEIKKEI